MFGNMENSHHYFDPAVNLQYILSPRHRIPWEFNASSPFPSSPPFLSSSLLFTVTYCFCAPKTVPQGTLNI